MKIKTVEEAKNLLEDLGPKLNALEAEHDRLNDQKATAAEEGRHGDLPLYQERIDSVNLTLKELRERFEEAYDFIHGFAEE